MEEKQKEVLKTVVSILKGHNISFQVNGGLAAIAYGSKRPLYDIDIDVNKEDIPKVQKLFKEYIVDDFYQYQDEYMSVWLITLEINGVEVDISQADEAYFTNKQGNTMRIDTDLSKAKIMEIEGIEIPVMDKEELIECKTIMGRDVDLEDVKQIS